jgi:DNA-binding NarL/FixJ family response regulator
MVQWLSENKQWVFSGVGVAFFSGLVVMARWLMQKNRTESSSSSQAMSMTNQNIVHVGSHVGTETCKSAVDANSLKATTYILFIDDDQKFKVVDILKKSGWIYTRRTSDIGSIDDPLVQQAQILFIDIQGVGRRLQFRDEGLGLAAAIKDKYPAKKVVIYSAQTQGERFHDALRKADDFLPKNADPYEFQQLTERLAIAIRSES